MDARVEFPLEAILPHRPPMRFLDAVGRAGPAAMDATWTTPADGPWIDGGLVRRSALVELAAQTAASLAGLARWERGLPAAPGYLGGIDGFRISGDVVAGERLRCRVEIRFRMGGVVRSSCVVRRDDGTEVAAGELSLVSPPDADGGAV
ncbi:MAG: hypothetical protein K8T90_00825 [Planctomycetes bacterium]|nr:hypothetical protein [Planctomycetota bacterium]